MVAKQPPQRGRQPKQACTCVTRSGCEAAAWAISDSRSILQEQTIMVVHPVSSCLRGKDVAALATGAVSQGTGRNFEFVEFGMVYVRSVTWSGMPPFGCRAMRDSGTGTWPFGTSKRAARTNEASMIVASSMANEAPMHTRGPAPNGRY